MARFAVINGSNRVVSVSDKPISNNKDLIVELPGELDKISSSELLQSFSYREGRFCSRNLRKPAKELRVALIANWGEKCGLGTYAGFLMEELAPKLGDYRIFSETGGNIDQFAHSQIPREKVISCWKRGESCMGLANEVKKWGPDLVLISHEYGLFPNARHWLSLMTQLSDLRVITILHSVFPTHRDKIVFEGAMPEIIVHSPEAKEALIGTKKLGAKVSVIPHGSFPCLDGTRMWNNYRSNSTFCSFGFALRYKAIEMSITAVSLLKPKHPDVFFTALCSQGEFSVAEHSQYLNELMQLIEKLGVSENVALIRGYFSEEVIDAYLRSNKVSVFPYRSTPGHECFGSSGAARTAMTTGTPVITSNAPHFTDLPSIKADSPEELAGELSKLFGDQEMVKAQVSRQNQYLADNTWTKTAERFVAVFEG